MIGLVCQSNTTRLQFGADLSWPPTLKNNAIRNTQAAEDEGKYWLETLDGVKYRVDDHAQLCVGMVVGWNTEGIVFPSFSLNLVPSASPQQGTLVIVRDVHVTRNPPLAMDWLMGLVPVTNKDQVGIERLIVLGDDGVTDEWLHCMVMRIPHVYVIPCLQSTRTPHLLPQTPIHSCFFPKAHLFAGLHLCPNPFRLDETRLFYAGDTHPEQIRNCRIVDPDTACIRPDESGALVVEDPCPVQIFTFANTPSLTQDQQVLQCENLSHTRLVSFAPLL